MTTALIILAVVLVLSLFGGDEGMEDRTDQELIDELTRRR